MEISGLRTRVTNSRYSTILCAVVIAATMCSAQETRRVQIAVGEATDAPNTNSTITLTSGATKVVITSSPPKLTIQKGVNKRDILLPSDLVQVASARLFHEDRVVIDGMVNADVWKSVIVDLKNNEVIDSFLCYSPAVSPNGRYIAFIKFFPAHGISSAEDRYMIYDVASSPAANRPPNIKSHPAVVGRVVYPPGVGNVPGDNVDIGSRPAHEVASETFFWRDDSSEFVFADRLDREYSLIMVKLNDEGFTTSSAKIPGHLICPTSELSCFSRLVRVEFPKQRASKTELEFRGFNGTPAKPMTAYFDPASSLFSDAAKDKP